MDKNYTIMATAPPPYDLKSDYQPPNTAPAPQAGIYYYIYIVVANVNDKSLIHNVLRCYH